MKTSDVKAEYIKHQDRPDAKSGPEAHLSASVDAFFAP
jgi:hypothetical protein